MHKNNVRISRMFSYRYFLIVIKSNNAYSNHAQNSHQIIVYNISIWLKLTIFASFY